MQKGYPTRIPYIEVLPDFGTYLPENIKKNQQKLAKYLLLAIGYQEADFKLGEKHVFYRPGKSTLLDQYNMSDETVILDLALKIQDRVNVEIQQREAQKSGWFNLTSKVSMFTLYFDYIQFQKQATRK